MDDICDSEETVEKARKQTDDIDTVLATGGFKVKGWTFNKTEKDDSNDQTEMNLFKGDGEETVPGIGWNPSTHKISLKVKADLENIRHYRNRSCISYTGKSRNARVMGKRI